MPAGRKWVVADRTQPIRAGDLFLFKPDDLPAYLKAAGLRRSANGLIKRFIGVDRSRRVVIFETTNPPQRIETGLDRLRHAYKV